MTLKELREARHEDFFLAVVSRELSWEEAENECLFTEEYPNGICVKDVLRICVEEALSDVHEQITEEKIKSIETDIKQTTTSHLEECFNTILLKNGEHYIDVSVMEELNSEYKIKCLVSLDRYYNQGEYSFEEDEEGSTYLNLDLDPFDKFIKDYQEGKFIEEL